MRLHHKTIPLAMAVLGAAGVCASLFSQYVLDMNPCVMCIQQRMALAGIFAVALLSLLLPTRKPGARTLAAVLVSAPAAFGLYIAVKQIHLQSLPLMEQPSCGAPWTFRLRDAPLFDWYEWFIRIIFSACRCRFGAHCSLPPRCSSHGARGGKAAPADKGSLHFLKQGDTHAKHR